MKRLTAPVALLIALLLAACTAGRPAVETAPATIAPPTVAADPTVTAKPPTTEPAEAPPTAAPEDPEPATEVAAQPPEAAATVGPDVSPLFGTAWDDRSAYAAGLAPGQKGLLDELPDAPVYHMAITIDPERAAVTGQQAVAYTNQEDVALEEVYFHLLPALLDSQIEVSEVRVNGRPVSPTLEEMGTVLRVPLAEPLKPGESTVIEMAFETLVARDIGRNYGVLAAYDNVMALAHFYPMLSVYDDTGWNTTPADIQGDVTYSDTAYYTVEVTAPEDLVVVAAGTETGRRTDGGEQTVTYAAGPARDFYLAASDEYVNVSGEAGGVTINSYARRGSEPGAALALDVAAAALERFSARFAPYPYSELDIVTTPTSALGIEYPGIIVITGDLYDLEQQTQGGIAYRDYVESTVAHEVAHQWFYNLVGNDQLDEPWLDEAMATFSTGVYYADRYGADSPQARGYQANIDGRWERVENADIPIGMPVSAYEGPEYGAIVYGRGALFAQALRAEMGEEAFDRFLKAYFDENGLGIADAEGFQAAAQAACDCDLTALFNEWVNK
jgi:hypothetical protein